MSKNTINSETEHYPVPQDWGIERREMVRKRNAELILDYNPLLAKDLTPEQMAMMKSLDRNFYMSDDKMPVLAELVAMKLVTTSDDEGGIGFNLTRHGRRIITLEQLIEADDYAEFDKRIGGFCGCQGPRDGEPLCSCQMMSDLVTRTLDRAALKEGRLVRL